VALSSGEKARAASLSRLQPRVTVAGVIHEHACRPPMRRPNAVQRVVAAIYDYLIGPNSCVGRG
jgi:hypothetical protein